MRPRCMLDVAAVCALRLAAQALIYSLTVASKSPSAARKEAALSIMNQLRQAWRVLPHARRARTLSYALVPNARTHVGCMADVPDGAVADVGAGLGGTALIAESAVCADVPGADRAVADGFTRADSCGDLVA